MHICSSVSDAFERCFSSKSFSIVHLQEHPVSDLSLPSDIYIFFFSVSGNFRILIRNRICQIDSGSFFFVRPFEFCHIIPSPEICTEGYLLFIHPDYTQTLSVYRDEWISRFNRSTLKHLQPYYPNASQTEFLFRQIRILCTAEGFGSLVRKRNACTELLLLLYSLPVHSNPNPPPASPNTRSTFLQACDILNYIDHNLAQAPMVTEIAEAFYLSPSYVSRIFKAHTGLTVNRYLNARRICLAKSLLFAGCTIAECTQQCGFHDYNALLSTFKKYTGLAPTHYLTKLR